MPVRIAIDGDPGRPMIAGLSAEVTVDTRDRPRAAWPRAASAHGLRPPPAAARIMTLSPAGTRMRHRRA